VAGRRCRSRAPGTKTNTCVASTSRTSRSAVVIGTATILRASGGPCYPSEPTVAEEAFRTAISIGKEQSARSYVLLASLSLAKLCQTTARHAEAHAVLAPALEGFTPSPEMPEIAEAVALLAALAETEEVRTANA